MMEGRKSGEGAVREDKWVSDQYLRDFNSRDYHATYYHSVDQDLIFFLDNYHEAFNAGKDSISFLAG